MPWVGSSTSTPPPAPYIPVLLVYFLLKVRASCVCFCGSLSEMMECGVTPTFEPLSRKICQQPQPTSPVLNDSAAERDFEKFERRKCPKLLKFFHVCSQNVSRLKTSHYTRDSQFFGAEKINIYICGVRGASVLVVSHSISIILFVGISQLHLGRPSRFFQRYHC